MSRGIDAKLRELTGGIYDIQVGFDGDVLTDDFFDTAILVSLLADQRADETEVPISHLRRGWIGNEATPGFQIGSKLWLFYQTRLTRTTMNQIADAARDALQWLVDDGLALAIRTVEVSLTPDDRVTLKLEIQRTPSQVDRRFYELWNMTGVS